MALVGGELSPVVAVQQVVGGGQRHLTPQALVQRRFDLADNEHATGGRLLQKGGQKLTLFFQTHVLALASTARRRIRGACYLAMHEATA